MAGVPPPLDDRHASETELQLMAWVSPTVVKRKHPYGAGGSDAGSGQRCLNTMRIQIFTTSTPESAGPVKARQRARALQ
jgi:hypothetical protein